MRNLSAGPVFVAPLFFVHSGETIGRKRAVRIFMGEAIRVVVMLPYVIAACIVLLIIAHARVVVTTLTWRLQNALPIGILSHACP